MADAVPVSGKRKAVKLTVAAPVAPEPPVTSDLDAIPEQYREAAAAAMAQGKRVSVRPKGGLLILS